MMATKDLEIRDYTTTVTILESITDAIFILTPDMVIEYANQSALNMLQQPINELIGKSLLPFIKELPNGESGDSQLPDMEHGFEFKDDQLLGSSEAELLGPHGSIQVLINMSSIPDSDGSLRYVILTAKEIGYRKGLEKELRRRQALSVSFDRLRALGEMSVGLVHTLGQPLTSMDLRLDQIKRLSQDEGIHDQVDRLKEDMETVSSIVENVRNYALASEGRQVQSLNMNELILTSLKVLEYELKEAGVQSHLELADDLFRVEGNGPELEQVLINLITNAMEAFEKQDGKTDRKIHIDSRNEEDKWIKVQITDSAGVIEPEIIPRIFEPFFSTKDPLRHSGTGLSVSRAILTSLGGDLQYSEVSEGARFQLRIPAKLDDERGQLLNLIELLNSE